MSSVLKLLFAPGFLILIHCTSLSTSLLIGITASFSLLCYALFTKAERMEIIILTLFVFFLCVAYFYSSFKIVKYIPVFTALLFAALFMSAAVQKRALIFTLTQRFYKKKLSDAETDYLKKGDLFWAVGIFVYALLLIAIIAFDSDVLWAFFSSLGWYLYFILLLIIQIIYGKSFALKMSA